jgi:hypothetical protein
MKKCYSIYLNQEDIKKLEGIADREKLPPRALARSFILKMIELDGKNVPGGMGNDLG